MISSISIDRFGDIDTLDLDLRELNHVERSSGGDSLFLMLLAMKQSCVPGYLHDWEEDRWSCGSGFGGGKLEVRGRLFYGGTFARCLHKGSPYCSCRVEFVLENPENPVCGIVSASGPLGKPAGMKGNAETSAYEEITAESSVSTTNERGMTVGNAALSDKVFADKKRAGADDFRELTRLYGEKFGAVTRFVVGVENAFAPRNSDNILSYQMVSVRCERIWEADITSFFELVLYKNGTNYELYWDELPDIRGERQSGRAKGCNVRMRNLQVTQIVTDGVQDGARFEEVLPSIVALSRITAWQFGTVKVLDFGRAISDVTCSYGDVETLAGAKAGKTRIYDQAGSVHEENAMSLASVFEPCRFVGLHGEYLDAVIRTYVDEKSRIAWPDPVTGEVRRGFFMEAFEAWRAELGSESSEGITPPQSNVGSMNCDANALAALVQGLVLRTGETLIIRGLAGNLPEKFYAGLARMGRQIIVL